LSVLAVLVKILLWPWLLNKKALKTDTKTDTKRIRTDRVGFKPFWLEYPVKSGILEAQQR
jgi:hypothetical protein